MTPPLRYTWLPVFIAVIVTACGQVDSFSRYSDIGADGWPYGQTFEYRVGATPRGDSVMTGVLTISVTHDNMYEYSNLWVEVQRYDTLSGLRQVDTLNIPLCDNMGNWYGKGLPGHYQLSHAISPQPVTLHTGDRISLRHIMRVDTLTGISQVGLTLQ